MTNSHPDPTELPAGAGVRIAQLETANFQLEATNTALREELSSKNAHIVMLEERLLHMSVELASSRAREDEQNLMLRRNAVGQVVEVASSQEVVSITPVQDDDSNSTSNSNDKNAVHHPETKSLIPNPVRNNKKHGRRRRKSGSSSVSPYPAVLVDQAFSSSSNNPAAAAAISQAQPTPIEDDCNKNNIKKIKNKSAPAPAAVRTLSSSSRSSSTHNRRFSFMSSNNNYSSFSDSTTSLNSTERAATGGGGVGNIIGNIFHNIDRSDKSNRSDDLSVNFPTADSNTEQQGQGRVSMVVGQLFRLRKSELTADDAVEEEEESLAQQEQPSLQRRRPNRSQLSNRHMMSTRLISSTVAFPRVEDDDCLGFE
eukprot:CAMPEP_0201689012 /NCGR_PEP_ID=MMETSP0578-20130828/2680_1 /ASSEMBLY_ACC=CAM_ASM_000663 /TAXON_ID=267565 /ORGANISM="Skeletonema grethea, Strain CCMP 1804" /LENGTH=368 /DNA_ID=CAMNT_0048173519 /DNA_START=55 /DNA_END=1161 /DNA_ORIENTATION=-